LSLGGAGLAVQVQRISLSLGVAGACCTGTTLKVALMVARGSTEQNTTDLSSWCVEETGSLSFPNLPAAAVSVIGDVGKEQQGSKDSSL
jgi:hypothetical protein